MEEVSFEWFSSWVLVCTASGSCFVNTSGCKAVFSLSKCFAFFFKTVSASFFSFLCRLSVLSSLPVCFELLLVLGLGLTALA